MKIAAVYIRVSTDGQMEQSPESQLAEIRKFAARNDYIIPDEFIFAEQDGISGRNADKRPEFQRMIGVAKAADKPFDAILVWKYSRFARNRQDSIIYKRLLRKQRGIEVISVNENIETGNDGLSELIEAMIEAMDEYYSLNLAEEVKRGMENKAKNGEAITHPPFGYKMINKKYVIDEERAAVVRMIFDDFALNGLSYYLIAKKLNEMGIKTLAGRLFEGQSVRYIINNPVYAGKLRWNSGTYGGIKKWRGATDKILVDGIHEAIITQEMWEKADMREIELQRLHKPKEKTSPAHALLTGIARCGNCGATMCSINKDAYQCGGYSRNLCTISHSITKKKLDTTVIDKIDDILKGGNFEIAAPTVLPRVKTENEVIAAQIKKQETKIDRIKQAYEAGVYDIDEMKSRIAKEQAALDMLAGNITETTHNTAERKRTLMKQRESIVGVLRNGSIPADEKNALLKTFVDKVVFTRKMQRDTGVIEIYFR